MFGVLLALIIEDIENIHKIHEIYYIITILQTPVLHLHNVKRLLVCKFATPVEGLTYMSFVIILLLFSHFKEISETFVHFIPEVVFDFF